MHLIFRHFWLLFLVVMLVNVAILWRRLSPLVSAGRASRDEVDGLIRGATIAIVVFSLASEAIVIAADWPNPFCVYSDPLTSPGVLASAGLTLGVWALLLWWVWRGEGANILARLGPAMGRPPMRDRPYTPSQVRYAITGILALIAIGTAAMLSSGAPFPNCRDLPF